MSVLITDSVHGVLEAFETGAPPRLISRAYPYPYMPFATREHWLFGCLAARSCICLCRSDGREAVHMPALPSLAALEISPCGRYVYQLCNEADCVHTRVFATGELQFSTRVGVFPRMMRIQSDGKLLLIAGGALNEAYLLRVPTLARERIVYTKSPCFAADFWRDGLLLVCAAEGEDIQTVVYALPTGGVRPHQILSLPGQPGGLCVCPDRLCALLSTPDGLIKFHIPTGRLLWNLPEWPLCMRLQCRGASALISDTLSGQACLIRHDQPWHRRVLLNGSDAQACFA